MKKLTLFSIALLMAIMTAVGLMAEQVGAQGEQIAVSTGLKVIAAQSTMGKYGISGGEIAFSPEDFERSLNARRVDHITFTELPDASLGTMWLGSDSVSVGQTVSRENIHKLSYAPKGEGISENSFVFTTGNGYDIECALYVLEAQNYSPVAGMAGELSLQVSTHRNVSVWGSLSGFDGDGDDIRFEIVSYPTKGIAVLTDSENGEFRYTPKSDFTGKDSFKYVVYDKYGNYSAASEVTLDVSKVKLDNVLSDMGGKRAHTAAITMVERGIMQAESNSQGALEFSPDKKVSREEFLVMAMKSAGINVSAPRDTGFADDAEISASAKGYVALAKEKGFISGTNVDGNYYFYPGNSITAAEAAVIINNVINASQYVVNNTAAISVFEDHNDIPAWAREAMTTLNCVGIINGDDGYLYPQKEMTRGESAMMLQAVIRVLD